ncbi:MAG: DNA polymerase III subunit delta' [Alphaproteobacteria bacterium]
MDNIYPSFHPIGHNDALNAFLSAWNHNKLHHAWLFCGTKAIGKAGVAHYLARFILTHGQPDDNSQSNLFSLSETDGEQLTLADLDISFDNPEIKQYFAQSNPNFISIQRNIDAKTGKFQSLINVDAIRQINQQLSTTHNDGYRVIIIDSIDEMNINAANAILKILEEPPKQTIFFLISHNPDKLLPTIISRCRKLDFSPLNQLDMRALLNEEGAELPQDITDIILWLADGAVGKAQQLFSADGQEIWRDIYQLFGQLRAKNLSQTAKFCAKYGKKGRLNKEEQNFELMIELWLRLIQAGCLYVGQAQKGLPQEIQALFYNDPQKSLDEWLQLWDKTIRISKQLLSGDIDRTTGLHRLLLAVSNL